MKKINILASLSTRGGGEQAIITISSLLRDNGWEIHLIPWDEVHSSYNKQELYIENFSFKNGMNDKMEKNIPLFFYGNDQIYDFQKKELSEQIIDNSSKIIIGINFIIGNLSKCEWIKEKNKIKAVLFLNSEKKENWIKTSIFNNVYLKVLFGASDIKNFINIPIKKRAKDDPFIVSRLSVKDDRKFVTKQYEGQGEICHCWQKYIKQELDIIFYEKLLNDIPNIQLHFMSYSNDLQQYFKNNNKIKFYNWDEISVVDFLNQSHIFLYRTHQCLRDQGPRVMSEAMAAGLPCLSEPRDGPKDRIIHGHNGFYAIEYDDYKSKLSLLEKYDNLRIDMGNNAKNFAINHLNPELWVKEINQILA